MEATVSHILLRINPSAMEITSPIAGRKCSFPLQEVHHFVYLFFLYLEIFLYPAYFAQTSHIVTGHSAYRVAECGGYQAGGRGQAEFDECHQYQFGTERHDAAGQ